jgi:hypothetical protein
MDGGMNEVDSIWGEDEPSDIQPPTDEVAQAIAAAVDQPRFMPDLLAYIVVLSRGHQRARFLGFDMGKDLPGGMCVESLAHTLLERILLGKRSWDMQKYPDFLIFCKMHSQSMVKNLFSLSDTIRRRSVSPMEEEDPEGNPLPGVIVDHIAIADDGNRVQRRNEIIAIVDSYLTDLALNCDDNSTEQKIIVAVIDDKKTVAQPREGSLELLAVDRPYMIETLKITGKEFDSGMKRLQRKHKAFVSEWLGEKGLTAKEIGELLNV